MRAAGDSAHGRRLRGLIVVLWRAGLRIHEALALHESDLDPRRGALVVRRGKGGRRPEVGMDEWGWDPLLAWSELPPRSADRPAVLHHHRPDTRATMVRRSGAREPALHGRYGRRTTPLRATSASARS